MGFRIMLLLLMIDVNIVDTDQAASHNDKLSFSTRQPTVSVDNGDQSSTAQVFIRLLYPKKLLPWMTKELLK